MFHKLKSTIAGLGAGRSGPDAAGAAPSPTAAVDETLPAAAPADAGNVIDEATLDAVRKVSPAMGEKLIIRLIQLYLETTVPVIDDLRQGSAEGDAERVRRAAHTLKSTSYNVGALTLSEHCKKIEQLARETRLDDIGERVDGACTLYEVVCSQLKERLARAA